MTDPFSTAARLAQLSEPFPAGDIEWRVSRCGPGKTVWCYVLAYITARAIQQRLDDVCGVAGWRMEPPRILTINGQDYFACGLSIWIDKDDWITKWDVCEPTRTKGIDAAKGGWSGAMKRAGAQLGIGRYLYYIDETYADTSETDPGTKDWNYAKTPPGKGDLVFYWKTPTLPGWALPKDPEHEVSLADLNTLKKEWKQKFATLGSSQADQRAGFDRFVKAEVGDIPLHDHKCWDQASWKRCRDLIKAHVPGRGASSDVPFDG